MTGDDTLGAQVARSLRWSYGTAAAGFVLQLGLAAVLARLLDPAAYGVIAVANTVIRYLQYFTDLGIGSTMVQRRDLRRDDDTALLFVLAGAANLGLTAVVWLAAPALVALVRHGPADASTVLVLRVMGLSALLGGLGQAATGLMRRDLDFRRLGIHGLTATAAGQGLVALPLAALGCGVWSLVAGALAQVAVASTLALRRVRHPLWPRRVDGRAVALLRLGGHFSALRLLDATGAYIPPFAVATMAGITAAGLYDRAFVLTVLPVEMLTAGLAAVLFPSFSRLQDQPDRLRPAYLSAVGLGACVIAPLCAGMAAAAPELAGAVLGPGWLAAAEPLTWLALWLLPRSLIYCPGGLSEACGWLWTRTGLQIAYLLLLVGGLAATRPDDAIGVLRLMVAVEMLNATAQQAIVARRLCIPIRALAERLGLALLPGIAVGGGLHLLLPVLRPHVAPLTALVAAIATAALLLTASLLLHPSRHLRREIGDRIVGGVLGIAIDRPGPLGWLRRRFAGAGP